MKTFLRQCVSDAGLVASGALMVALGTTRSPVLGDQSAFVAGITGLTWICSVASLGLFIVKRSRA